MVSEQRYRDFLTDRTGIVKTAKALVVGMSAVRRTEAEMQRGTRPNLAKLASPIQGWRFSEEITHDRSIGRGSPEENPLEQVSLYWPEATT